MKNKNKIKEACFWLMVVVLAILAGCTLGVGIKNHERKECYEWQKQAREYPGFYLTDWQKEQCDHYSIKIEVKKK